MPKQPIELMFSAYRRALLALLLLRPDERLHVRELARLTGISPGSIHRELKALAESGLLLRSQVGNQVLYQANRGCPIFTELAAIFRKTVGLASLVRDALAALAGKINLAFIFGSMASGEQHASSDVDVLIIGDVSLADAVEALAPLQPILGREINPVVMTRKKFRVQRQKKERFVNRVLDEPKLFLIGDADELGKLVKDRQAHSA